MRSRAITVLALVCAAGVVAPLAAQPARDTTTALRLRRTMRALEQLESGIAARNDSGANARRTEQRRLLDLARAQLDTVVMHGADGGAALARLMREFPGGALLREYDAWRRLADGRPAEALARFDALLRASRRNPTLLRGRARALDALRRRDEAVLAWERLLDAVPSDEEAFGALWRHHEESRALPSLHPIIGRLRLLWPADTVLLGREVRLLQAMGLHDSAAAVVRRFTGGPK